MQEGGAYAERQHWEVFDGVDGVLVCFAADVVMSGVKAAKLLESFERRSILVALSRPAIDALSDGIALCLGERGQGGALRQVLANQAVGVLVGTALPGVVGRGEVELETSLSLNGCVAVELGSVVGGDGLE